MIEIKHLTFAYDKDVPVLKDISFTVQDGESVGLIGANGAGKSTLMKALLGLVETHGEIRIDDTPVTKDSLSEIRRRLGFVLQNSDNQMFMPTVNDDILFGLINYGMSKEDAEIKADEALARLGASYLKNRYNHRISGGEKRMAAIAAVLAMEPSVILMDEPTSALDPKNRRMIINTINSLRQTKIITSHDLDMIRETCERVILIDEGKVIADGDSDALLRDEELLEKHSMELPLSLQKIR